MTDRHKESSGSSKTYFLFISGRNVTERYRTPPTRRLCFVAATQFHGTATQFHGTATQFQGTATQFHGTATVSRYSHTDSRYRRHSNFIYNPLRNVRLSLCLFSRNSQICINLLYQNAQRSDNKCGKDGQAFFQAATAIAPISRH
jgi:hypothetical protein